MPNPSELIPDEAVFETAQNVSEIRFTVPASYPYLEGHFPGNPIVPGVTQIGWARLACQQLRSGSALAARRYRFLRPVRPGQQLRIRAEETGNGFVCQVFADEDLASKGQLYFEEN